MASASYTAAEPDDYTVAIVCAMVHEFDPIEALFDEGASCTRHGPAEDKNVYVVGRFADHHTDLMMPGEEGELDAGMCTQRLRDRFRNIELTLLVGICGAMSQNFEADEPMFLGDVIVGILPECGVTFTKPGPVSWDVIFTIPRAISRRARAVSGRAVVSSSNCGTL